MVLEELNGLEMFFLKTIRFFQDHLQVKSFKTIDFFQDHLSVDLFQRNWNFSIYPISRVLSRPLFFFQDHLSVDIFQDHWVLSRPFINSLF